MHLKSCGYSNDKNGWMECGILSRDKLSQGVIKAAGKKNAAFYAALREGYKTLISMEEVCISRVAAIVSIKSSEWNVAYCRVTDCRRSGQVV